MKLTTTQPTRQPVAENDLPADPTVIVRFQRLSMVAMRLCCVGAYAKQSY
jgi:hypothetical protein